MSTNGNKIEIPGSIVVRDLAQIIDEWCDGYHQPVC